MPHLDGAPTVGEARFGQRLDIDPATGIAFDFLFKVAGKKLFPYEDT